MRCQTNSIEHRFTRINHPWTNGQVERMNRTIKDATGKQEVQDCAAPQADVGDLPERGC